MKPVVIREGRINLLQIYSFLLGTRAFSAIIYVYFITNNTAKSHIILKFCLQV